jgi:hypothetical protein
MATNQTLSDGALVGGSISVTIDGYVYLFKTFSRSKPIKTMQEGNASGLPGSSFHARDFQKITGEIKAYTGTPEPSQNVPFLYDSVYWTVGNLTLTGSSDIGSTRSYNVELNQLAGTSAAAFTTT